MMRWTRLGAAAAASGMLMSGCAQLQHDFGRVEQQRQQAEQNIAQVSNNFEPPGLVRTQRPLLGLVEVPKSEQPLPALFDQEVSFASFGAQSLPEILDTLSRMTRVAIAAQDVLSAQNDRVGGAGVQPAPGGAQALAQQTLAYRYSGRLRALLDDLTLRLGASWKYDHDTKQVVLYRYESRTFNVMLPMGKKDVTAGISIGASGGAGGGSGGAGAGGGTVSIQSGMTIDPWSSMMDGVRVFLGQQSSGAAPGPAGGGAPAAGAGAAGSSVMMASGSDGYAVGNRDLAQLIVVARPQAMQRIAQFVEQTNRRFARNVLIDVRVVEIQSNRGNMLGAGAGALLQTALASRGIDIGLQIVGAPLSLPGQASQMTITANKATTSSQLTVDAIVQALASVSTVSVRNQGQIVAINGQPAPFQQANQVSYVANIQTTQTPNVGSQTSVQPGTVTVGFTANFIPTIMADNRIMLQYQIQSSSLLGLRTVGPDNAQIQVPEVYTQSLQQQAYVRDGDVIVLFGFEQERSQINDTNGLWSQGRSSQNNHIMTAVIIQVRAARDVV